MSMRNWLRNNFVAGVLVIVPVLGTLALFWWLFDEVTGPGYGWLLKRYGKEDYLVRFLQESHLLFRLVVLFAMLGAILLVGALARNFLGRRVIRVGETFLARIPVVKRVYKAFKQMSEAFWGEQKTVFSGVVAVEYPREGLYSVGFLMSSSKGGELVKRGERVTSIFVPTTPNLTVGWFVMVPEEKTIRLNMKVEDAIKMIVSGGAVVPDRRQWLDILEAKHRAAKAPIA
ncbi:MAG: DUF502 domain-containing protein [bacterium]|nr:DUF502 domain-containing protein [bacterium]